MLLTLVNTSCCLGVSRSHRAGPRAWCAALLGKQPLCEPSQRFLAACPLLAVRATQKPDFTRSNRKTRTAREIFKWREGEKSILIPGIEGCGGRRLPKIALQQWTWQGVPRKIKSWELWHKTCGCRGASACFYGKDHSDPAGLCGAWVSEGRGICFAQRLLITCKIRRK